MRVGKSEQTEKLNMLSSLFIPDAFVCIVRCKSSIQIMWTFQKTCELTPSFAGLQWVQDIGD
jgi:hypothetical protein